MHNWRNINITYLYDGTFNGLLTVIFECYLKKIIPVGIVNCNSYEVNIFNIYEYVETDESKSNRLMNGINNSISNDALYNVYNAFLSKDKGKEMLILNYLILGFKVGPKVTSMLSIDYVFNVYDLRRKVLLEAHRIKGLLRFIQLREHLYYASVHLDNNVIESIGQHFIRRLPKENFIIHDKNRDLVFMYNTNTYQISNIKDIELPKVSNEELLYQELWKKFYKTISIKERKNPRLQKGYMPRRYWKDLIEDPYST